MSFNELSGRIGRARWLRLGWFKASADGPISETPGITGRIIQTLRVSDRA